MRYDPWADEVLADPYPFYAELRAGGGCHELPDLDMWVLSSYEHVNAALRDHRNFSSIGGVSREVTDGPGGWIFEDPPSHTATRAMAAPVFSRGSMPRHATSVQAAAIASVEAFVAAGGGDAVTELAQPIAVQALCHILGVPNDCPEAMAAMSESTFVDISRRSASDRPDGIDESTLAVAIAFSQIIEGQLEREVAEPSATMLDMITAHVGEDAGFVKLNRYGRAAYLTTLVSPGVETTRTMMSNAVELAARFPDAWDDVRAGRVEPARYVAEVLRYESPVQGFFRGAVRDVEIGAATIPSGARVLCLYGAANRDEAVFDDAASFRPDRSNAGRHLAYGVGIHRCIGAWLAESEAIAAIEALAKRVERFEVNEAHRRTDTAQLRSWSRLVVSVR